MTEHERNRTAAKIALGGLRHCQQFGDTRAASFDRFFAIAVVLTHPDEFLKDNWPLIERWIPQDVKAEETPALPESDPTA